MTVGTGIFLSVLTICATFLIIIVLGAILHLYKIYKDNK